MISTVILQTVVVFGAVQISKPFAHLIFVRLCLHIVFPVVVIVLFKTAGHRDKFMAYGSAN